MNNGKNRKRAYIFGAGHVGTTLLAEAKHTYDIIAFLDNDKSKWGKQIVEGFFVQNPETALSTDFDIILVASLAGFNAITAQLSNMGVPSEKICTNYVRYPAQSRIVFLERLAWMFYERGISGCVAECGVFMGEFAREINRLFPKYKLYLFDTFAGFDERDIVLEQEKQYSELGAGHFNITSEEIVLSKLQYPDKCIIKKGYFPETTAGVDETFCFVNLDFDLYQPTLSGLEYFAPRMVSGGVILIHDYFAVGFKGVKAAVKEFESKTNKKPIPIGDGLSVMFQF
jgi:hypothetical protein